MLHAILHPIDTLKRLKHWRSGFVRDPRGFQRRNYRSYAEYLTEQVEKLDVRGSDWLSETERTYQARLTAKVANDGLIQHGQTVLCLGARLGAEVRAFRSLGAFAIGIDLNPGPKNDAVCYGDFHALAFADQSIDLVFTNAIDQAFADQSIDLVFTNAIDHAFDLDRLTLEIRRVLKVGGLFVAEIVTGNRDGTPYGYYDAMGWTDAGDVAQAIRSHGFTLERMDEKDDRGRHWTVLRRRA